MIQFCHAKITLFFVAAALLLNLSLLSAAAAEKAPTATAKAMYHGKVLKLTPEQIQKGLSAVMQLASPTHVELDGDQAKLPDDEKEDHLLFLFAEPAFIQYERAGEKPGEKIRVDKLLVTRLDGGTTIWIQSGKRVFMNDKVQTTQEYEDWKKQVGIVNK